MVLIPSDKKFFDKLISTRHPLFQQNKSDWEKWRTTYEGGDEFLDDYLKRFSKREGNEVFKARKAITPISGYAKIAVNRMRNAIFQRMGDIIRRDGSQKYQESVAGEKGGVDRRGASMNFFMGFQVLTDLLVMGRYGVYVDNPDMEGALTAADTIATKPYMYGYRVEDILSWQTSNPEDPNEFQALLLRDVDLSVDDLTFLPLERVIRFRWVFIDPKTGQVNIQFISREGKPEGEPKELPITRIPFHVFDIGGSLMKDICNHQIALLNIDSANVSYNILANYPFLTEKRGGGTLGPHWKQAANAEGTATEGGQGANEETVEIGNMTARLYDEEAPAFISPPSDPLEVSRLLRGDLVDDIDRLVSLAVSSLPGQITSDNEGLESGLAFVANVMQTGERRLAEFFAIFEETRDSARRVATVGYPDRFSLKSDGERVKDANDLGDLMAKVPGRSVKKELAKTIASTLLSSKVNTETMDQIIREIDEADYCTSDPDIVEMAIDKGLVSNKTASVSLGYPPDEHIQAQKDRAIRIALTKEAQKKASGEELTNPAARGVDDESVAPQQDAASEKELSRETDEQPTTETRVRGKAK